MTNKQLRIEVADTPFKRQKGLMFRSKLEEDEGMMFEFNNPQNLKFWGLNTFIPLSIAFVKNNKIAKIDRISPFSTKCVESESDCSIAIEANHDFFEKNNIGVGSQIDIIKDGINDYVIFK
jgi:uncharacterized membrane protein (UPF0127 family)